MLKKLIRTPRAPLAQIIQRLSKVESTHNNIIQPITTFCNYYKKRDDISLSDDNDTISKIKIRNIFASTCPLDNTVISENKEIVRIVKIDLPNNWESMDPSAIPAENFHGYETKTLENNVFDKPCSPKDIGIMQLGRNSTKKKTSIIKHQKEEYKN